MIDHIARRHVLMLALLPVFALTMPAYAAGDLLVAPTRLVLDSAAAGEVLLSNKGAKPATYRASLVLKKMLPDGQMEDVATPSAEQQAAMDMISYAPRKVVLAPGQTQTVRVGVRAAPELSDGEYRVHLLFRAVPDMSETTVQSAGEGVAIALTPVYGVTIPVIARKGKLAASAKIENVRLVRTGTQRAVAMDLAREGNRSIYGSIRMFRPGAAEPVAMVRGVAVYPELARRSVTMAMPDTGSLVGPVIIRFTEEGDVVDKQVTEIKANL